jgi:hypothetical protein
MIRKTILLFCLGIVVLALGCNRAPKVTSPASQELILRFYTACNTKDRDKLNVAASELNCLVDRKMLSREEERCFRQILELAQKGGDDDWNIAADMSYSFSMDQVR